jgi:glycerophosphoryl diester phosphodiesterase
MPATSARESTNRIPLIAAHRGSSGEAPENTMAAFRLAVEQQADWIELDVRLTKDFFLVVHHDRNVERTTNGKGSIWNFTLEELRMLDAGSWFGPQFKGERIPTLRQVMELLLPTDVKLNIEVKTDGDPRKYIALEEACILAVLEKRFEERAMISSFNHEFVKRVHNLYPSINTGVLYVPVLDRMKKPSKLAKSLGAKTFICSRTQIRKPMVEDARGGKTRIACYGVNSERHIAEIARMGVDMVITDFPARAKSVLTRAL